MRNYKVVFFFTLLLAVYGVSAQEKDVNGTVTDNFGVPLAGVNIVVQSKSVGTQTDFDGEYTIKVSTGDVLVFSYLGFKTREVTVGASSVYDVSLEEDTSQLDEVVVTALGISREKKSLGYATQELDSEEVNVPGQSNFVNALSGKAAGVNIQRNNNLGGSTNVVIRGITSLTGNNQALFVIDGVPLNNSTANEVLLNSGDGGYDYGNAVSDIDPNSIETVNVLKGAAATALYGSRASNGAIIITTKKGKRGDRLGVTINSSVTFSKYDKDTFIEYQSDYGQSYYGAISTASGSFTDGFRTNTDVDGDGVADPLPRYNDDASYGPAFNPDLLVYQWNAFTEGLPGYLEKTPWVKAKNGPSYIFRTAQNIQNTITLEGGSQMANYRATYTNTVQTGILPGSEIVRNNVSVNTNFSLSEKLSVAASANFNNTRGKGRNGTGYDGANARNLMTGFRQWWATNVDLQDLEEAYNLSGGRNITWNRISADNEVPQFWDNPYFTLYKSGQEDDRNRFFGNVSLDYKFTDWLSLNTRVSVDTFAENRDEWVPVNSVAIPFYQRFDRVFSEYNYDAVLTFNKDLSDSFNLTALAGLNIRRTKTDAVRNSTVGGLLIPEIYALSNSANPLNAPVETRLNVGVDGVFGSVSLGYKNFLYLDGTIRRDKSSTLPLDNNTFDYPSISTSFVFSEVLNADWLTFGKLRLNYAEVGNGAPAQSLINPTSLNLEGSFGSQNLATIDISARNPELKPETTTSMEAGLEMSFANRRLGFDVAVYKTNSKDQIFPVNVSTATGFISKFVNSGEIENKGIEVSLFGSPIRGNDFAWDFKANWSKNQSKVLSLFDGVPQLELNRLQTGISIMAEVGRPYGTLSGSNFVYHENGQPIVDQSNGAYLHSDESEEIGDTNPDWLAGITNTFRYKNVSLSFLIDVRKGGDIYSVDTYYGYGSGLYPETAGVNDAGIPIRNSLADGGGYIFPGVTPDGAPNTFLADVSDAVFSGGLFGDLPQAYHVYDGSFVKLRQLALTYDFPSDILKNTAIHNLSISLTGTNLWIIHKNLPYADPEAGFSAGNTQGVQIGAFPTTKNYGLNVKLQF